MLVIRCHGRFTSSGIHPRLKRPVGYRLAVAAAALLHPADPSAPVPLTGPTVAGCSHAEGGQPPTLTLKFDTKLLGDDNVQVRPFETNMSLWAGVDSLTAMVFLTFCGVSGALDYFHPT